MCRLFLVFVINFFYDLSRNVIKERNGVPSNRKDFIDLILELIEQHTHLLVYGNAKEMNGKKLSLELTDDLIAAQAFVFYGHAGHQTSATTMGYLLYEMAKNPNIQEKLIAEVDEVLARHNGQVTYKTVKGMVYFDKVLSETLRMYPVVDTLQRNALTDYKIPETDIVTKKGITVLVPAYGIQHDEKYYPDPDRFDPERHASESSSGRHTSAYIPFGIGSRNCIGMRFSKLQVIVCMIKFFSKFRVTPCKATKMVIDMTPYKIVMGPKGGVPLNVIVRKKM